MDTDWCLNCGRHTSNDEPYCSSRCKSLDQSSQSVQPRNTSYFDLPVCHPPASSSKANRHPMYPSRQRQEHSLHQQTTHNLARFLDEELQGLHAGAYNDTATSRDERERIVRWAKAVQPGLVDDRCPSPPPYYESRFSQRPPPFFPLTAPNLAPPCLTYSPRLVIQTRPKPITSNNDRPFRLPATTPTATDNTSSSLHTPANSLNRLAAKVAAWMSPPPEIHVDNEKHAVTVHSTSPCYVSIAA